MQKFTITSFKESLNFYKNIRFLFACFLIGAIHSGTVQAQGENWIDPLRDETLDEVKANSKYDFQDPHLFPNLNKEELFLIFLHPVKMFKAYQIAWEAKKLCSIFFDMNSSNGPGDACRHFVWAALLYERFGKELSEKILIAHENDERQTLKGKEMDLANNLLGLVEANRLKERGLLNPSFILKAFQENLQAGHVLVLTSAIVDPKE